MTRNCALPACRRFFTPKGRQVYCTPGCAAKAKAAKDAGRAKAPRRKCDQCRRKRVTRFEHEDGRRVCGIDCVIAAEYGPEGQQWAEWCKPFIHEYAYKALEARDGYPPLGFSPVAPFPPGYNPGGYMSETDAAQAGYMTRPSDERVMERYGRKGPYEGSTTEPRVRNANPDTDKAVFEWLTDGNRDWWKNTAPEADNPPPSERRPAVRGWTRICQQVRG